MFAKSLAVFVLGALLFSTASCAADRAAEADDDAVESSSSELRSLGVDEGRAGLSPSEVQGELDKLGRPIVGSARLPNLPNGRFNVDDPLEPFPVSPFSPSEIGCYVREQIVYEPGTSRPSRIYVTVCP